MAYIQTKDISYTRDGKNIVSNLDITLPAGELTVIMGPSGAGKTTLLCLLSGIFSPTSGHIEQSFTKTQRSRLCGYAFLEGPFLEDMSVMANLLSLELFTGLKISRERLTYLSKYFSIDHFLSLQISQLSSGQRERVSLVRAFLHDPEIVFIDEPGSNLDDAMTERVRKFIIQEVKTGRTIVLSTHDPKWKKYSDNVILLSLYEN